MTDAKTGRLRRFRTSNPRHDYYPGQDAQKAVSWFKARNPSFTMQEVMDALITAGGEHYAQLGKQVSGNV